MKTLKLFLVALIALAILTTPTASLAYDDYLPAQNVQQAEEGDPDGVEDFTSSGVVPGQESTNSLNIWNLIHSILRAIQLG